MAELPVYNRSGEKVGAYVIEWTDIAPRISRQLLHDAVVMYQANQRQGSHHSRSRSEVAGSRQKMYRQKGTGRARAGTRQAAQRRGGGHVHDKKPRDYSYRLPRKALQAAVRMAVASKVRDDEIVVVDELAFAEPKTREMAGVLRALKLEGQTTLLAVEQHDVNTYKSGRNIPGFSVCPVADLNALAVLTPRKMLITKAALDQIKQKAKPSSASDSDESTVESESEGA